MSTKQLTRSKSNRIIAGVAGGISEYTGLDLALTRLITAIVVIFTGVGLVAYILAWILLPEEGTTSTGLDQIMGAFKKNSNPNPNPNPNDLR